MFVNTHKKGFQMINVIIKKFHSFYALVILFAIILSGCAKQKTKTEMQFEELKTQAITSLKKENLEDAAETLEAILAKNQDRQDIHQYKIILADVYFKLERYPSAYQMYQKYTEYYPSHPKAEYCKYQAILSKFYQTLKIDCDQTITLDTINTCKEYTLNNDYKKYLKDVLDIQNTCEHKLINKEIYVFNFYLEQEKLDAAKSRLNHLKTHYLPKQPSIEPRLHFLTCKLAKKMNDQEVLTEHLDLLVQKYPLSQFCHMAQTLGSNTLFIF